MPKILSRSSTEPVDVAFDDQTVGPTLGGITVSYIGAYSTYLGHDSDQNIAWGELPWSMETIFVYGPLNVTEASSFTITSVSAKALVTQVTYTNNTFVSAEIVGPTTSLIAPTFDTSFGNLQLIKTVSNETTQMSFAIDNYLDNGTDGSVAIIQLLQGGSGYNGSGIQSTTSLSGTGTGLSIDCVVVDGSVTLGTIANSGTGYAVDDEVEVSSDFGEATFKIIALGARPTFDIQVNGVSKTLNNNLITGFTPTQPLPISLEVLNLSNNLIKEMHTLHPKHLRPLNSRYVLLPLHLGITQHI
jgi:hypothetical protein